MKVKLNYENREYFHPSPTPKMMATVDAILDRLGWEIEIPAEKLTRSEAKSLIAKGKMAAKRRGIQLFGTWVDEVNKELTLV